MQHKSHEQCITRLRKIEGQVRGVVRMIEEKRYCIDILTQVHAVKAALAKVESEILKDHALNGFAQPRTPFSVNSPRGISIAANQRVRAQFVCQCAWRLKTQGHFFFLGPFLLRFRPLPTGLVQ
jgi:DNA-binding FrmR family transcriptional regulator